MMLFFCGGFIKRMQQKEQAKLEANSEDGQSQTSDETIDVEIAHKKKEKQPKYWVNNQAGLDLQ